MKHFLAFCCVVLLIPTVGCSPGQPKVKTEDRLFGLPKDDRAMVEGFVEKAGIKGNIVAIIPKEGYWEVDIQPAPKEGSKNKRAMMTPPDTYIVKKDGSVAKQQ